jgi:GGDEF domain-containing protein
MEKKLAAVEKRVQEIETSDPDTGLATKTQFIKKVREEVARARRYQLQFSLLVVQVTWGTAPQTPEQRQESLLALTDLLRHCCRQVDLFSRFNDTTFASLLPHTGTGANVLGDRIVRAIAREKNPFWVAAKYHTTAYPSDSGTAEAVVAWLRRH